MQARTHAPAHEHPRTYTRQKKKEKKNCTKAHKGFHTTGIRETWKEKINQSSDNMRDKMKYKSGQNLKRLIKEGTKHYSKELQCFEFIYKKRCLIFKKKSLNDHVQLLFKNDI